MKTERKAAFTLIEIMIVIAIIGVIGAIAIPAFGNAMSKARRQACAINRKNIDGAKLQWAAEHQQPPEAQPTDADLFGENAYIEHKPDCPAHGVYSLNEVRQRCACSVAGHTN